MLLHSRVAAAFLHQIALEVGVDGLERQPVLPDCGPLIDIYPASWLLLALLQLHEAKCFPIMHSHVFHALLHEAIEIISQMLQLLVSLAVVVRQYRHAIINIESVRQTAIINDQHLRQGNIFDDPQILDAAVRGLHAVLPVQSSREQRTSLRARVLLQILVLYEVEHGICVGLLAGRVACDVELASKLVQTFQKMRPKIKVDLLGLILQRLMRYVYCELEAHTWAIALIKSVHHRLINIKNQQEFIVIVGVPVGNLDARQLRVQLIELSEEVQVHHSIQYLIVMLLSQILFFMH